MKKERYITNIFGMELIVRKPKNHPKELNKYVQKQFDRTEELINRLIKEEFRMPAEEEIKKEIDLQFPRSSFWRSLLFKYFK